MNKKPSVASASIPITMGALVLSLTQKQKDTLSNSNRRRLYELVCDRPGIRLCELRNTSGLKRRVVVYHTTILKSRKLIKWKKERKYVRYYKMGANFQDHPGFVCPVQQKIYDVLAVNGPMSQKDICSAVDRSQQLVSYHLKTFREANVVFSSKDNGVTLYGINREMALDRFGT